MDPKMHPLTAVVKLIKTIQPTDGSNYCLYVEHHEMHICRSNLVPKDLPIIDCINSLDINTGFTRKKWDRIDARIRILIKQGALEWNLPKPLHPKTPSNCSANSSTNAEAANLPPKESETTQSLY